MALQFFYKRLEAFLLAIKAGRGSEGHGSWNAVNKLATFHA